MKRLAVALVVCLLACSPGRTGKVATAPGEPVEIFRSEYALNLCLAQISSLEGAFFKALAPNCLMGVGALVPPGTKVAVLPWDGIGTGPERAVRIRVLEGEGRDFVGFVPAAWVHDEN